MSEYVDGAAVHAGGTAVLICTDALLDTRAKNVEEMELISALCVFVERASRQ